MDAGALYPRGPQWPGTPMDSTDTEGIYKCPEDETMPAWSSLSNLKYLPPPHFGVTVDLSAPDNGMWIMSRAGEDDKGSYRDFLIQDDGSTAGMSWHGWIDIDGLFRVYESGLIWIMASVPNTPEFRGAYPGNPSSCGDYNRIFLGDKPAFGSDGCIQTNRGRTFQMEEWDSNTNYAINSYAYLSRKSLRVVLVDYKKKLVADPDTGAATEQLLHDSARHLGRVNVLDVRPLGRHHDAHGPQPADRPVELEVTPGRGTRPPLPPRGHRRQLPQPHRTVQPHPPPRPPNPRSRHTTGQAKPMTMETAPCHLEVKTSPHTHALRLSGLSPSSTQGATPSYRLTFLLGLGILSGESSLCRWLIRVACRVTSWAS